eukprot:scaffold57476_cov30-Tisochrysis_lutea.AAC.1
MRNRVGALAKRDNPKGLPGPNSPNQASGSAAPRPDPGNRRKRNEGGAGNEVEGGGREDKGGVSR